MLNAAGKAWGFDIISLTSLRAKRSNLYNISMRYSYVYILTNEKNTVLYIGVTDNLIKRVYQHKMKLASGFTSKYNVSKLVYYEIYEDITEAINREKQLKGGSRKKKIDLVIKSNPYFADLYKEIASS